MSTIHSTKDSISIKPAVIWLTGLSAAGKTTIAHKLAERFNEYAATPVLLDGDDVRKINNHHRFDEASRKMHNLIVGRLSAQYEKAGRLVIVALISPYVQIRNQVSEMCVNFIQVHVATGLQTCMQRDPKGLYKKALNGQIKDFTGISAPYEAPTNPDVIVDTTLMTADEAADKIIRFYFLAN